MRSLPLPRHLLTIACALLAALCSNDSAATGDAQVVVTISAINYTDRLISPVWLREPQVDDASPGDLSPYTAGVTVCCYVLPRQWHPGLQVELAYYMRDSSFPNKGDHRYLAIDLPRYEDAPTMLWVLFHPDDEVQVLASSVNPGHPQWTGREPGWPIPSRAHRLRMLQQEIDQLSLRENDYKAAATETSLPDTRYWLFAKRYAPQDVLLYWGEDDPRFIEYRQALLEDATRQVRERIRQLEASRP